MSYATTVEATSGLVGYWKMDETSGTEAKDAKGSHAGTYSGSYTLGANGPVEGSRAVHFTGGKMAVPDAEALRLGKGAFTRECFFNAAGLVLETANLSLIDDTKRAGSVFLNTNAGHEWLLYAGGTGKTGAAGVLKPYAWYHLVITGSGSALIVYLNGEKVLTKEFTAGESNSNDGITFAGNPSGGGHVFEGYGSHLALYNTTLSEATVEEHWAAAEEEMIAELTSYPRKIRETSGLKAYWRLNETEGTTAVDQLGKSHGTYQGPAKEPGEEYGYALGEPGFISGDSTAGSVDFGGGESELEKNEPGYVELTTKAVQTGISKEFSVEAWVELRKSPNNTEAIIIDNSLDAANEENEQAGYALAIQLENRVVLFMSDSGPGPPTEYWAKKEHALELHTPYHVAITYKEGVGHIYVNGKEVEGVLGAWNQPQQKFEEGAGVPGTSLGAEVSFVAGCGEPPRIGVAGGGSAGQGYDFTGRMAELAVYSTMLSAATVEEHFAAGTTSAGSAYPLGHHNKVIE